MMYSSCGYSSGRVCNVFRTDSCDIGSSETTEEQVNYEKFIGENLFGKMGILIFVIGVGFFVKYAIDRNWINETFRTVLGFLTGAALLVVAGRLQKKYRTFSSLLAGGAFAVFLGLLLWLWKNRKEYKFLVYTTLWLVLIFVSLSETEGCVVQE